MANLNNTAKLAGTYAGNEVTNTSTVTLQSTGNFMVKLGDRIYGDVGTTIKYTIDIMLESLVPDDLKLIDMPDEGLEFIDGTLKLNDVSKTGTVNDLIIDFQPNTSYSIEYQAVKTKAGDLKNYAYLTGTYCGSLVSIESAWVLKDTGTTVNKTADRDYAEVGTITNYTIDIAIGDICPTDLVFTDAMDEGLEFVEGTLKLNDEPLAISLDELVIDFQPNSTYKVEYQGLKVKLGN